MKHYLPLITFIPVLFIIIWAFSMIGEESTTTTFTFGGSMSVAVFLISIFGLGALSGSWIAKIKEKN